MSHVTAVVGGQFGSEGKGLIVGHIARDYANHVRVGAANAGHTFYDEDGQKRVMQQLPCAAYANPKADLFIGPGALISADIFHRELDAWSAWRNLKQMGDKVIYVDARAHVIQDHHIKAEQASGLAERIGSTSTIAREGIGCAQAARVMREEACVTAEQYFQRAGYRDWRVVLCDVPGEIYKATGGILLEGTQGTGLSLTTGAFPFVTSRNTTASGLAADVGIGPLDVDRVILVARTYPIRVAGPSGPFWADSKEIEWGDIGVDPENERTTVTRKIRRVATFSLAQLDESIRLNSASEVALTFCDYMVPEMAGETELADHPQYGYANLQRLIKSIEAMNCPVAMLGTGPKTVIEL